MLSMGTNQTNPWNHIKTDTREIGHKDLWSNGTSRIDAEHINLSKIKSIGNLCKLILHTVLTREKKHIRLHISLLYM